LKHNENAPSNHRGIQAMQKQNGAGDQFAACQRAVKMRAGIMKSLTPLEQSSLGGQASLHKSYRDEALREQTADLRDQRALAVRRQSEADSKCRGVVNKIDSFKMGEVEKDMFNAAYESVATSNTWDDLQNQFCGPPGPVGLEMRELLESASKWESKASALPDWMGHICRNRDLFHQTAIFAGDGLDPDEAWMPLIITQSPFTITWMQCVRVPVRPQSFERGPSSISLSFPCEQVYSFRYTDNMCCNLEVPFDTEDSIWVLEDVVFTVGDQVRAPYNPIPYSVFCRHHPRPVVSSTASRPPRRPNISQDMKAMLQHEFPWLTDVDLGLQQRSSAKSGSSCKPSGKAGGCDDESEIDAEEEATEAAVALAAQLLADRAAFAHDVDRDLAFYVHNRGGAWTIKTHGRGTDTATCFARAAALPFCRKFAWPRQKGFTHTAVGGEWNSNVLAREWARLGQHYFVIWLSTDCLEDFVFAEEHKPDDDEGFIEWVCGLDIESHEFSKVLELRHAFPVS
jgi:hypothetical protein